MGGEVGQGFELAEVILGELAEFFSADFGVGEVILEESLEGDHTAIACRGFAAERQAF